MPGVEVDAAVDPELLAADPYPIYKRLRAQAPICFVPNLDLWMVTRFDDVERVLVDHRAFPVDARDSAFTRIVGSSMASLDGEAHSRVRAAFEPAVIAAMSRFETRTALMMDEALARISPRGTAEIMEDLIVPVSVAACADTLGLGEVDPDTVRRWFAEFEAGALDETGDAAAEKAATEAKREFGEIMAAHAVTNDVYGSLLAHLADSALSREEMISNLTLLMLGPAGFVGLVLWSLLVHPEEAAAVRRQPASLPRAVTEALRWQSPEGAVIRLTRERTRLGRVELPPGATVAAVIASANRDDRHFIEPDRFLINRLERHVAFGFGPHSCPGAKLGHLQVRVMVERLLSGLPGLRLDPEEPAQISGWMARAPAVLPVRWDAV